ncbi:uncharacterized protein [Haliotis asinina]|uniref:uncharacterized protein n=1 Tax=Haliotis asinina TaxID=109174 RepID=UPI003531EC1D
MGAFATTGQMLRQTLTVNRCNVRDELGHTSDSPDKEKGTNGKTLSVPDLVKSSVEPFTDAGDYTEITEEVSVSGVSLTTANNGMPTVGGSKPEDPVDSLAGQYNILRESSRTITDDPASARHRQTGNNGSSAEYFVLEESDGNYNRLGKAVTITATDGFHRPGDTFETGSPQAKDTEAPPPEYFVLEEPVDTYNKLGVAGAVSVMDTKNTYHRLGTTDADTRNRDPGPFETVLEMSSATYNKLREKTPTEDAQSAYNKLGEVTSERRT